MTVCKKNQPRVLFADHKDSANSSCLNNSSISLSGSSTIEIDCEFSETYPQASCVLVYREYDSPLLTVVDIPQLLHFPVSITVDSPENYTFALFGKNGALMEEKPLVFMKFNDHGKDTIQRDIHKNGSYVNSILFVNCGANFTEPQMKQRERKRKAAFPKLKLLPYQLVAKCLPLY